MDALDGNVARELNRSHSVGQFPFYIQGGRGGNRETCLPQIFGNKYLKIRGNWQNYTCFSKFWAYL